MHGGELLSRAVGYSTGYQYLSVRAKYEHSRRMPASRKRCSRRSASIPRTIHIADCDRDRTTAIFTITPIAQIDINVSVSTGKDNYRNTGFGLRDNNNNTWSVGFDAAPVDSVTLGVNYGFEKYTAFQYVAQRQPAARPRTRRSSIPCNRDWSDDQPTRSRRCLPASTFSERSRRPTCESATT